MNKIIKWMLCLISFILISSGKLSADVLGPYPVNENVEIPSNYASLVITSSSSAYESYIYISDENGQTYYLTANPSGDIPNRYLLEKGTYTVVAYFAVNWVYLSSNWGVLNVGSTFTVTGNCYMTFLNK
jgi:hypothetical protein